MGDVLRVSLDRGAAWRHPLGKDLALYGGRALVTALLAREAETWLRGGGAGQRLVLAPGLLAGLGASSANRCTLGAIGPDGMLHTSFGGPLAGALACSQVRAVVIEGQAAAAHGAVLLVRPGQAQQAVVLVSLAGAGDPAVQAACNDATMVLAVNPTGRDQRCGMGITVQQPPHPPRQCGWGLGNVLAAMGLHAVVLAARQKARPAPRGPAIRQALERYHRQLYAGGGRLPGSRSTADQSLLPCARGCIIECPKALESLHAGAAPTGNSGVQPAVMRTWGQRDTVFLDTLGVCGFAGRVLGASPAAVAALVAAYLNRPCSPADLSRMGTATLATEAAFARTVARTGRAAR